MNFRKPLLIAGAVTGIGLATATGIGIASAATNQNGSDRLVDKLATRFNLNKDEVNQVFEEEQAERQAEMQQTIEERLTQAVAEGKLTEEQKQKVLAKQAELRAEMEKSFREGLEGKTKEERIQLMQQRHEELQKWASDNGIPLRYLSFGVYKMGPGGPGHGMFEHKLMVEKEAGE